MFRFCFSVEQGKMLLYLLDKAAMVLAIGSDELQMFLYHSRFKELVLHCCNIFGNQLDYARIINCRLIKDCKTTFFTTFVQ